MATGHYARTHTDDGGQVQLLKARDRAKDQSYVLHVLNQERLQHACFPIGEYPKSEVREIARRFNLPIAERPDSQDLCFLGNGDYHSFLLRNAPDVLQPGPILNRAGVPLGEHQGLAFYTIGQRKGLGLAPSNPLYVLEKDVAHNALIVGYKHELGCKSLTATQMNWIDGAAPSTPFRAEIKIRYKAREAWAVVTPKNESSVEIQFDEPVLDITPGQAAVIYNGDICLGGGIIQTAG
jgi:tRNA-specific 2-thiouridylase